MQTSEAINELAMALSKAQGEITGALKDSANPFFKSKYADLASFWDACRPALAKNAIAVIQIPEVIDGHLYLTTTLAHSSGQWMRGSLPCNPKDASDQATGSSITYARRYALAAFVGIAQVDDDGNASSGRGDVAPIKTAASAAVPLEAARTHAMAMMAIIAAPAKDGDHDELQKAMTALDYQDKHLKGNNELYIAAAEQMDAAKRNIWKALINKAKEAEKADKAVSNAGRRF